MKSDYKVLACLNFSRSYEGAESAVVCEEFKSIAAAFSRNMERVKSLSSLPLEINFWSSIFASAMTRACMTLDKPLIESSFDDETRSRANDYLYEFNKDRSRFSEAEKELQLMKNSGTNLAGLIRDDTSGALAIGFEAFLSSMIMEAWSAFEAMAIDLWVAALNKKPRPLAINFCNQNKDKNINLDQVAKYGFDMSGKMGNFIKEFGKVNFDSLSDIVSSYNYAFNIDFSKQISSFDKLYLAEKTRHLIAHRSGIVDEKYLRAYRGKSAGQNLQIGNRLALDGEIVSSHINACIKSGMEILSYVDRICAECME